MADTSGAPAPELAPYTRAQIDFAAAAWPLRAAEELRSALIFRALAVAAARAAMPAEWVARFGAAARDEVGHARLCAAVGRRLGADLPRYDARPVRARLEPLRDPLARATALLLVEVAMGETVSMAMFRAGRRAAVEPLTRATLHAILSDEVRHQRLGWSALGAAWPALPQSNRRALQDEARRGLAAMEQQIAAPALRRLHEGEGFDPAHGALGVIAPEARVEGFYAAVERLVLPRLSRLGLDGAAAWHSRYSHAAT
jgi:hypothetical protein